MALIDEALISMLQEVEHIAKDKKNTQQNYNFRGIDDVYNAVHPLLAKHGVYPTSEVVSTEFSERETQRGGTLFYVRGRFRYTYHAKDGSTVQTEAIGEAMDSGDKASNKAMSNAYKYALFQLLCIPTMAIDGDQDTYTDVKPQGEAKQNTPPQDRNAFQPPKNYAPPGGYAKPESLWSKMTTPQQIENIKKKINSIVESADSRKNKEANPREAMEALSKVAADKRITNLPEEAHAEVQSALLTAEEDINILIAAQ